MYVLQIAAVCGALISAASALLNSTAQWPVYIKYTTETGYFLQDDPETNATTFDYVSFHPTRHESTSSQVVH